MRVVHGDGSVSSSGDSCTGSVETADGVERIVLEMNVVVVVNKKGNSVEVVVTVTGESGSYMKMSIRKKAAVDVMHVTGRVVQGE